MSDQEELNFEECDICERQEQLGGTHEHISKYTGAHFWLCSCCSSDRAEEYKAVL